ncbi:MAG: hypothetical protein M1832_005060 [Thelocarpon impressellum]|nr:MAG: hypothetical protein M1832_005060 [Thelocarpon impressellum]
MGNACGKETSHPEPFAQPGRTLSSAPPPASGTASVPKGRASVGRIHGGGPRTLGGPAPSNGTEDARAAAAQAAEERARRSNSAPKGKLGSQLASQKQQTRTNTLGQASRDERRLRETDDAAEVRNWT